MAAILDSAKRRGPIMELLFQLYYRIHWLHTSILLRSGGASHAWLIFQNNILMALGKWNRTSHPNDYPGKLAHFSSVIGGTHRGDHTLWRLGAKATTAVKKFSEWGDARSLLKKINKRDYLGYDCDSYKAKKACVVHHVLLVNIHNWTKTGDLRNHVDVTVGKLPRIRCHVETINYDMDMWHTHSFCNWLVVHPISLLHE